MFNDKTTRDISKSVEQVLKEEPALPMKPTVFFRDNPAATEADYRAYLKKFRSRKSGQVDASLMASGAAAQKQAGIGESVNRQNTKPVVTGPGNRVAPPDQERPTNIPPDTLVRTGRGVGLSKDIKTTDKAMTPINLPDVKKKFGSIVRKIKGLGRRK
tara:strand:- start:507 stop:980 length:474 start_codon:yes stop_codon:yes gene_type:complete